VEGISVSEAAPANIRSAWLIQSAQSSPRLEANRPFLLHYLAPDAKPVLIEDVRASLLPLGSVSVQELGEPAERRFMLRMEDRELEAASGRGVPAERIIAALENSFGQGAVAVTRSDYVGSRFSKNLTDQVGVLISLTLLLVLAYISFRFKPQYAFGAVIGIVNDAIVIVAFVVWSRMEFNTSTIAAILTILGYSVNNTIVVFDRVRENRRIFPDEAFVNVLDRSLTGTLNRTIITTVTTMLAVVFLFVFTTGSMKDFALALLVGLTSGVYTTTFIASGFVHFWEIQKVKREKRKLTLASAGSKA
jgi:preprotein translocase subunit SecF